MQVEIFTLCDAATLQEGKLNILGTFDTIWVAEIPAVYPQCAVAMRLRFTRIEAGRHQIAVHVVDVDGQAIIPPLGGEIEIAMEPDDSFSTVSLVLNIQRLPIKKCDECAVQLAVDKIEAFSLPFRARKIVNPEGGSHEPHG